MGKRYSRKRDNGDRQDVYERVTATIVEQLEKGVRPWCKPWAGGHVAGPIHRPLRSCGTPYRGINVLMLWVMAEVQGYTAPIWMTYKQAQALGGQVSKGEKSALVTYSGTVEKEGEGGDDGSEGGGQTIRFRRGYSVFNVEQIDGLPAHYYATHDSAPNPDAPIAEAEAFFAAIGADIRHGGLRAFFSPGLDHIQMPPFEAFDGAASYYETVAHEAVHWTSHESRLDREMPGETPKERYANEELVAEIGAAFLAAELGLAIEPREDHAAYIANWLQALKNDKRLIFKAAAEAQKAADYLIEAAARNRPAEAEEERAAA